MDRTILGALSLLAVALGPPPSPAAECPPGAVACTPDNDPGTPAYDDSVSDLAYSCDRNEVWAIEGPLPNFNRLTASRITVYREDLRNGRRVDPAFKEPAFGIAFIPKGYGLDFEGDFYVLSPGDFDPHGFFTLAPRIGVMDPDGKLVAGGEFRPVTDAAGGTPEGFFATMDFLPSGPDGPELAILSDSGDGPIVFFLGLDSRAIRGPFRIEGASTYYGMGITYSSPTTVLITSQFKDSFEAHLALEYGLDGRYTGNLIDLLPDESLLPIGLTAGWISGTSVLYLYDVLRDAIFAVPDNLSKAPGPVRSLSPSCTIDDDGRAHLTWEHDAAYSYDRILVRENGVLVAALDRAATEYISPAPVSGKFVYCLETAMGQGDGSIQVCCEGQGGKIPSFLPAGHPGYARFPVDDLEDHPHFQTGIACPKVVERKEDLLIYVIGSLDNEVRVADYALAPQETRRIITRPIVESEVVDDSIENYAVTGIALLETDVQGKRVRLYALLDPDGREGASNPKPRASLHYLEAGDVPGRGAVQAGETFQAIDRIDTSLLDTGFYMFGWDIDPAGNFVAVDSAMERLLLIRLDMAAGTMAIVSEARLPIADLTPNPDAEYPRGGVTVLPSGCYLVSAGFPRDSTVTRAFLLAPMEGEGKDRPLRILGPVEGLLTFGQFFDPSSVGREVGPPFTFGLATSFMKSEGPFGTGILLHNMPHFFPAGYVNINGNFLYERTSSLARPELAAEGLLDAYSTLEVSGSFESGALRPSFADRVDRIDCAYHVVNPSRTDPLHATTHLLLDGKEAAAEEITIPPGLELYRRFPDRAERTIGLVIDNLEAGARAVHVLIGAASAEPFDGGPEFVRGDASGDGKIDLSDAIATLQFLFLGGEDPACPDAADDDDSGRLDLTDPIYVLQYLFLGGEAPPAPGPRACGPDPTEDLLGPCAYPLCS
jgi:hypothetical protein